MISLKELLMGADFNNLPKEIQDNLLELQKRINIIRAAYGKPMVVTSGLRTMGDQLRIYAKKGITDPAKIPMGSQHLTGGAVDIADAGLILTCWLKDNPEIQEESNLFFEEGNSNWVHAQIHPFKSYKPGKSRWFLP